MTPAHATICPACSRPLPEPSRVNCPVHHDWQERFAICVEAKVPEKRAAEIADGEVLR